MENASAATAAKNLIDHYERMEDLNVMGMAKGGESRRAHDFIRVDLPLMINAAEGRNPRDRDLTPRQKALLDLSPKDAEQRIESDLSAARRVLGWTAPFAKGENREFILGQDEFTQTLKKGLVKFIEEEKGVQFNEAAYTRDASSSLSEEKFKAIIETEKLNLDWPQPGNEVIFENEQKERIAGKIEEIRITSPSADSAIYYREYRMEGEEQFEKRSKFLDPDMPQHGYGVVLESAGKLYYVQTESVTGPVEPERMTAREIYGAEKGMMEWLDRGIDEKDKEGLAPINERGVKWALALENKAEAIAGEFTYRSVDGPEALTGPIILKGSSWQSGADQSEKEWAGKAVERHLEKYEFPSRTIHEELNKQRATSQVEVNAPKQETLRLNQQYAAAMHAKGQGW